jgi:hypothetical protein
MITVSQPYKGVWPPSVYKIPVEIWEQIFRNLQAGNPVTLAALRLVERRFSAVADTIYFENVQITLRSELPDTLPRLKGLLLNEKPGVDLGAGLARRDVDIASKIRCLCLNIEYVSASFLFFFANLNYLIRIPSYANAPIIRAGLANLTNLTELRIREDSTSSITLAWTSPTFRQLEAFAFTGQLTADGESFIIRHSSSLKSLTLTLTRPYKEDLTKPTTIFPYLQHISFVPHARDFISKHQWPSLTSVSLTSLDTLNQDALAFPFMPMLMSAEENFKVLRSLHHLELGYRLRKLKLEARGLGQELFVLAAEIFPNLTSLSIWCQCQYGRIPAVELVR